MNVLLLVLLTAVTATTADLPGTWQGTSPDGDLIVLELSETGECRWGFVTDLDSEPLTITLVGAWQAEADSLALAFDPEKTLLNGLDLDAFLDQMLEGVDLPPEEVEEIRAELLSGLFIGIGEWGGKLVFQLDGDRLALTDPDGETVVFSRVGTAVRPASWGQVKQQK